MACVALRDRPPGRAARARTSSTRPASRMSATRSAMRRGVDRAREPHADHPHRDGRRPEVVDPGPNDENGRPVRWITSSARTIRRRLSGSMRAAAAGSRSSSSRYACSQALGRFGRGFQLGAAHEVLAGDLEIVDDGAHVEAGPADEQRAPAAGLDVAQRRARRGLRAGDRPVVVGVGDVDEVVGTRRRARPASASPCRCPCPGTPASSRAR